MANFMMLLGRWCLAVIFLMAGVNKFVDWNTTLGYMQAGMGNIMGLQLTPMMPVLLVTAALVEILGALALIFGNRTRLAAGMLALFLIPTTLIFHNFWMVAPDQQQLQMMMFFKNLSIFGGLLVLLGAGPGRISADAKRIRRHEDLVAEEEHTD